MKEITKQDLSILKFNSSTLRNIFGIVLYTERNAFLRKVLNDKDYWESLDMRSGNEFTIFATMLKKGKIDSPNRINNPNYMVPIWLEPEENKKFLEALGITDSRNLPTFTLYANLKNQFHTCSYIIESESIEQTYKSLRDICDIIDNTIKKIEESNHQNTEAILRELKGNINYSQFWKKSFKGLEVLRKLKSFAGI